MGAEIQSTLHSPVALMPLGWLFPEGMHKGTVRAQNLLCKLDIHLGQYMVLLHMTRMLLRSNLTYLTR